MLWTRPSATPRAEIEGRQAAARAAPVDIAPSVAPSVAPLDSRGAPHAPVDDVPSVAPLDSRGPEGEPAPEGEPSPATIVDPGIAVGGGNAGFWRGFWKLRQGPYVRLTHHSAVAKPIIKIIGHRFSDPKVGCECCLEDWSTVAIGASRLTMTPCVHARFPPHMALQAEVECAECQSLICEGCSNRVEEGVLCCWCHSRVGIDSAVGDRMATDPYSPIDDTAIACSSSSSARPSTIAPSPIAKGQQADDEEALPTPKMPQESPSPKSPVVVDISEPDECVFAHM